MKFHKHKATLSLLSSSFFLTTNLFCTSVAASASTALRGVGDAADADAGVNVVLAEEKRGVFLVAETEYEDGHDSQTFNIMIDDIIYELDDVEDYYLDLETTTKGFKSGQAIIIPPGVALDASSGKAKLNGAKIEPDDGESGDDGEEQEKGLSLAGRDLTGEQQHNVDRLHRHLDTSSDDSSNDNSGDDSGDKKIVVVRVTYGSRYGRYHYPSSAVSLRRSVFGLEFDGSVATRYNNFGLSSVYEQCSYGQLKFIPVNREAEPRRNEDERDNGECGGPHDDDCEDYGPLLFQHGVLTLYVPIEVVGINAVDVQNKVTNTLKRLLTPRIPGDDTLIDLTSVADHWMYCLPHGSIYGSSSIDWKSISYEGSWLSVHNGKTCEYPSAQIHSVGRNLNFGLSKEGEGIDESGMMGRSYTSLYGPAMCFNAAKSWQSGWYGPNGTHGDKTMEITLADGCIQISLSGIADYDTTSNFVLVKIVNPENNGADFFVSFNAKKGINGGTKEAADQVTIAQQDQVGGGSGSAPPSNLLAKLSAGESYTTINNWTVEVDSITGSEIANVKIYHYSDYKCGRTTNGPQSASYDASFGTPKCSFGFSCDSEGLLDGRGSMRDGNEPNHPNTLNNFTCTDGNNGSYHNDESIDKIVVSQPAGMRNDMAEGDTVTISATVWCYSNGNGDTDYVDFYYASDASNPVWTQIGERQPCPGGGAQTVTAEYILPAGSVQAVRVNMMYENTTAGVDSCVTNEFADTDDLIISVMPKRTNSPSLSPSIAPSDQPTTATPSSLPSYSPTEAPSTTSMPSNSPTNAPSSSPSMVPSSSPSLSPSTSSKPSGAPSMAPSITSSPTNAPSSSPSMVPSSSPSLSPSTKPMKTLVCGLGHISLYSFKCLEGLESTAAIDTQHEVRCCRDCEGIACLEPWKRKCPSYDSNVFALSEHDGVCLIGTFYEAVDFCRLIPGENTRLCTPDELRNGCAKDTGCGFNKDLIWSCAYNGHVCSTDEECCGTCNASGICEGTTTPTDPTNPSSNLPSLHPSSSPSTSSSSKPSMAPISSTTSPSSSPSQQLSSSPSHSLSPSTKPMKTLVCGKGTSRRPCPEGLETTAAIDTKHEVRCCRDCEGIACLEPWKRKCPSYDPNLFALSEDDGVCLTGTFYEAVDFCRLIPGDNTRLCTPDELKNGCAKFTGCNFNKDLIWSCAYNGHVCSTDEECCGTCNASGICEGSY